MRGCVLSPVDVRKECFGDFTCLNTVMAEVPTVVAQWIRDQGKDVGMLSKMIRKLQLTMTTYVAARRS